MSPEINTLHNGFIFRFVGIVGNYADLLLNGDAQNSVQLLFCDSLGILFY